MEDKVYWSSIEYSYEADAEEYGELKGGFVYVFCSAFDVRQALGDIILKLEKEKLKPIEIEFLKPYEEELEWETEGHTNHYLALYREVCRTKKIVFDDFQAYEQE